MREQVIDSRSRMGVESVNRVAEVGNRIDLVRLAGGDDRVKSGEVLAGIFVSDKEKIFATERGDAQGSLGAVVVYGDTCVVEETGERCPLIQCVADRFAEGSLR